MILHLEHSEKYSNIFRIFEGQGFALPHAILRLELIGQIVSFITASLCLDGALNEEEDAEKDKICQKGLETKIDCQIHQGFRPLHLLFETSLVSYGYTIHASRIHSMINLG